MKAAGVSGAELARRMGVEPPMVSRVLRHTGNVQLQTLAKMAAALELEPVIKLLRKGEEVVVCQSFCLRDKVRQDGTKPNEQVGKFSGYRAAPQLSLGGQVIKLGKAA
jgi:transcriptional regulator with XRE-family HTH domain